MTRAATKRFTATTGVMSPEEQEVADAALRRIEEKLAVRANSMSAFTPSSMSPVTPRSSSGISSSGVGNTTPEARTATYKALCTKLAWAVGSCFGVPYGRRTEVRKWAAGLAERILKSFERRGA